MGRRYLSILAACSLIALLTFSASGVIAQSPELRVPDHITAAIGTGFTYQGQLKNASGPINDACDFEFSLWDSLANPTGQIGTTQTKTNVTVATGLFTVQLDFGEAFNGEARWLQIAVRCPAGGGSYTTLTPRQTLTPAPYALALPGVRTQQNVTSTNIVGGYSGNSIVGNIWAATIGGGGRAGEPNAVHAAYGTVGGGVGNIASGWGATVSGGAHNTASNTYSMVPGGGNNTAAGMYSFAAGRGAIANHDGAFVWGDSTNAYITSTTANQFMVRANGGASFWTGTAGFKINSVPLLNRAARPRAVVGATPDSANDVGQYTSVTISEDGLPKISYYDVSNTDLKLARCSDDECSAASSITLDSAGDVGLYTSIAIGADGFPVISYYDATNGNLKVAHCNQPDCATFGVTNVDSSVDDVGRYTSIMIGYDALPLISYYDLTNGDLKVAHCNTLDCTDKTIRIADSTNNVGQYTSIANGGDWGPTITYYDFTSKNLKAAYCGDGTCAAPTITIIDSAGDVGQYTSVTTGIDGLPLISYYDATNGSLKVAHCWPGQVPCLSISPLDVGGAVGQYTSITIGADGLGLISYYGATNPHLAVAHCINLECTGATPVYLDAAGGHTAITLGADGLGLISYYDATNSNLKTVHLPNVFGLNYFRRR
ncbi:MAG: hypothetical protein HY870_08055 [Chloroflexi bacterium]|nr:hypothetical protein [Chloroflexota bacterium]